MNKHCKVPVVVDDDKPSPPSDVPEVARLAALGWHEGTSTFPSTPGKELPGKTLNSKAYWKKIRRLYWQNVPKV